jgi:hypothetical protein
MVLRYHIDSLFVELNLEILKRLNVHLLLLQLFEKSYARVKIVG